MTMSVESLQDAASHILATTRVHCESPNSGALALALAVYVLWRDNQVDGDFDGFLADFIRSVKELHQMNNTKGPVQ